MLNVDGTRLACPVGHVPKAQRSEAIGILGLPRSLSRTVRVECEVFVSAVSYDLNAALPLSVDVKVPASGRLRSEYSMRIGPMIGDPSAFVAVGRLAARIADDGTRSPSQPASAIV